MRVTLNNCSEALNDSYNELAKFFVEVVNLLRAKVHSITYDFLSPTTSNLVTKCVGSKLFQSSGIQRVRNSEKSCRSPLKFYIMLALDVNIIE